MGNVWKIQNGNPLIGRPSGIAPYIFAAKPPPLCLPPWERHCVEKSGILVSQPSPLGKGDRAAVDRVLSQTAYLRRSPSLSFIPLFPSNLRPFGAPPSIGRRECPREPLPLEGVAERSEAGLASFLGGEAASSLPSPLGKALCREKRYPRIAAFPIGEGGPRQRWIGCVRKRRT